MREIHDEIGERDEAAERKKEEEGGWSVAEEEWDED